MTAFAARLAAEDAMRKPRDVWTKDEREEIDTRALASMQRMAALGDYVSFEVCQDLAQLSLMRRKLDEIEKCLSDTPGM